MQRAVALSFAVCLCACGPDTGALCADWASATCPAEYPNLVPGVSADACRSNFDFGCRSDSCDAEYEARILCETAFPNCCNATECNNAPLASCATETRAWDDCVDRLRTACED